MGVKAFEVYVIRNRNQLGLHTGAHTGVRLTMYGSSYGRVVARRR